MSQWNFIIGDVFYSFFEKRNAFLLSLFVAHFFYVVISTRPDEDVVEGRYQDSKQTDERSGWPANSGGACNFVGPCQSSSVLAVR